MAKYRDKAFILIFLLLAASKVLASSQYYVQDQSNGELYLPGHSQEISWTIDRSNFTVIPQTFQPLLFDAPGVFATTTTDQYIDRVNLWVSGGGIFPSYTAWYSCNHDTFNWSNPVDNSKLTEQSKKVSFVFPFVAGCNLRQSPLTGFGVYYGQGVGYPSGLSFLASNQNPMPNAGPYTWAGDHGSIADGYDIKAEVLTKSQSDFKTPVLIIPGVLGTNLNKTAERLWLDLGRALKDVGDEFMDPLSFNTSLNPLDNTINTSDIVINPDNLFDYSDGLIKEFKNQEYFENNNLFTFPYDWRYGVSGKIFGSDTVADLLKSKIDQILDQTGSDKIDIIAHSTGGLLVKKYVADHLSDHHINKLVMVGVPNLGAPKALKVLMQGDNFGIPWLADGEMKKISQNFPVIYDLAPTQKYYDTAGSYFSSIDTSQPGQGPITRNFDHSGAEDFLKNGQWANAQGFISADNLHTADFDNLDLRSLGVDVYSVLGCKMSTISKVNFIKRSMANVISTVSSVTGDGTVPLVSASSIPANDDHKFYAINADHGKMLSADGIRQKVVNIISGSNLAVGDKIKTQNDFNSNVDLCKLKGHWWEWHSLASLNIIDQNGNQAGLAQDGSIQNKIPGADYQIWGEKKFIFLPSDQGQIYKTNFRGTDKGMLIFKAAKQDGDSLGNFMLFINIPITSALSGKVNINNDLVSLSLDKDGDGVFETELSPSAVLSFSQSLDVASPTTTPEIIGDTDGSGGYKNKAQIKFAAVDPIITEREDQTSGIFEIYYSIDGGDYVIYDKSSPQVINTAGPHLLKFFSTDKAGNNEPEQQLIFSISSEGVEHQDSPKPQPVAAATPTVNVTGGGFSYPLNLNSAVVPKVLGASTNLPARHPEGSLILFPSDPTVYLVSAGLKHPFYSAAQFLAAGFIFTDVETALSGDSQLMLGMPFGE